MHVDCIIQLALSMSRGRIKSYSDRRNDAIRWVDKVPFVAEVFNHTARSISHLDKAMLLQNLQNVLL